jgi:hypothetical protein
MIRSRKALRAVAAFLLVQFASQIFLPSISYALTSGPSQPEFSSFEPVSTANMVDEFSGDFTYNLPVLEVPGPHGSSYPLSLSYHSGVTPEEEASWVGYGWTLNPGAINRNVRGVPDDFNGINTKIKYYNRMPKNWTASAGTSIGIELFSLDIPITKSNSVRYNNYRGFGYSKGIGISLARGIVSLGYHVSDQTGSFSMSVDPSAATSYIKERSEYAHYDVKRKKKVDGEVQEYYETKGVKAKNSVGYAGSTYGIFSYSESSKPNVVQAHEGNSYNVSFGFQLNPVIFPAGATMNINGSYSYQKNLDEDPIPAYGYLYSDGASGSGNQVMDYHVEKETDFSKRDVFLGVPFNDADNFIVTGEGLGGGFRLYNKTAGHFGPRSIKSTTNIYNLGLEIDGGLTSGVGLDLGVGWNSIEVADWKKDLSGFKSRTDNSTDEPVFFRFNNDLGGEWGQGHKDDKAFQASISSDGALIASSKDPVINAQSFDTNNGERSGRSSFIGYTLNSEMLSGSNPSNKSYNKNKYVNTLAARGFNTTLIGELAVFNESGNRYVYALPVFCKNEKNISYSLERSLLERIDQNQIVYYKTGSNLDSKASIKVGQSQDVPYASSYLLTEITTPDYIDRGEGVNHIPNGPTPDDLGGYTRFNYKRHLASYHWRAPYRGLIYAKNSHSDPKDDLGTYSEGEKQIYYIKSIETKSHVAIFITSPRLDSKEAPLASSDPLTETASSTVQLEKLDRIELYSIQSFKHETDGTLSRDASGYPILNSDAKSIKTVRFEYDNNLLSTGLPNAVDGAGKLTLTKVYFEYNQISQARISPYQFKYNYPDYGQYPSKYTSGTENVTENYAGLSADAQNKPYSPFTTDPWGNYWSPEEGESKASREEPWIDQKLKPNINFDPAAWHLKVIALPSGGEIHVQYEQDDYNYVQNQEAHIMAKLVGGPDASTPTHLVIDAASVGLDVSEPADLAALKEIQDMIVKRYEVGGKQIYFKILYTLIGDNSPDFNSCNSEFITGYVPVKKCSIDAQNRLYIDLNPSSRLPRQVCEDFVKANRLGMVYTSDCSGTSGMDFEDTPDTKDLAENAVRAVVSSVIDFRLPSNLCTADPNYDYSFLRIPTSKPKKGGGVRVKRLLMFDKGINGEPVLYGNEYLYQTKRNGLTISSGVATNEPGSIREENILVDHIKRGKQTDASKIVAGDDKKQSEGPIGESILPGASVGYSKIIVKNIHSGKTNPGFSITEFYTAKDNPISIASVDNPGSMTSINKATPETIYMPLGPLNIITDKSWATQGFSFVINSMHGQMKSTSSYSGPYSDYLDLSKSSLVSRTSYEYYKTGEKIPMMSSLYAGITMKNPGREVDVTFAQRKVIETVRDINVEADLEFSTLFPYIMCYPTAMPSLSFIDGALYTHAISKVVRYPAIVKRVEMYQDGITHVEENTAFDEWTGRPIAVKSYDEFGGAYLAQNIPASWQYKSMTAKWKNQNKVFSGSFAFSNNSLAVGASCDFSAFTQGDLIELGNNTNAIYHIVEIDRINYKLKLANAIGGVASIASPAQIKIIRSARTNQLTDQAGSITFFAEKNKTLVPPLVSEANRYGVNNYATTLRYDANNYAEDLQSRVTGLTGTGVFTLQSGREYTNMDMSAFADQIVGCNKDLSKATVRKPQFVYTQDGNGVKLDLMSFEIKCSDDISAPNGGFIKFSSEGWNQ